MTKDEVRDMLTKHGFTLKPEAEPEPIDPMVFELISEAQLWELSNRQGWNKEKETEHRENTDRLARSITSRLHAATDREAVVERIAEWLCESNIGMNGGLGSWEERQHFSAYPEYQSPVTVGESCRSYAVELLALLERTEGCVK